MALKDLVPEGCQEDVKLDDDGVYEESVGKCRPRMVFNEGHQKTESNQHHDVDVLIHGIVVGILCDGVVDLGPDKDTVHDDHYDLNHQQKDGKCSSVSLMRTHLLI